MRGGLKVRRQVRLLFVLLPRPAPASPAASRGAAFDRPTTFSDGRRLCGVLQAMDRWARMENPSRYHVTWTPGSQPSGRWSRDMG